MMKPGMIFRPGMNKTDSQLHFSQEERNTSQTKLSPDKVNLILRKPRSRAYLEAIGKLDAGGVTLNPKLMEEIRAVLEEEFKDIHLFDFLLGYVSKCYLGDPYEVHTLDLAGNIVTHYKTGEPLPGGLEKARNLVLFGDYKFVEVYKDCCRGIYEDGSVAVIK